MRLIGTLDNENDARRLTTYLKSHHIDTTCDVAFDAATSHMSYQIWVHDEDRNAEATSLFAEFKASPSNPLYDLPLEQEDLASRNPVLHEETARRKGKSSLTLFIFVLCCLFFFLNLIEQLAMEESGVAPHPFALTPVQSLLLIDVPAPIAAFDAQWQQKKIPENRRGMKPTPEELEAQLKEMESISFFRGLYNWILLKAKGQDASLAEGPLLMNVRQGELWRLFSPALLHINLLHLLFNMIWLWILGRPIEERIGPFKTLLLTVATGVAANAMQYFMSGPFFLGYSGVVSGLAGFTWMRERKAPWEGYPMNRATFFFLAIFIGGMFFIQLVSFLLQIFTSIPFEPGIANTAHIAGALVGIFLARTSFFAARVKLL